MQVLWLPLLAAGVSRDMRQAKAEKKKPITAPGACAPGSGATLGAFAPGSGPSLGANAPGRDHDEEWGEPIVGETF